MRCLIFAFVLLARPAFAQPGPSPATSAGVQEAKLLLSDGAEDDFFGGDVSLSGDRALIGTGGPRNAAFVFVRSGAQWSLETTLTASDGDGQDGFGQSVSLHGNRALIGAAYDDDNGQSSGAAYVFVYDGTSWAEEAKLTPADGAEGDYFGNAVALFGDRAIVGAAHDDESGSNGGAAYVFVRDGSAWTEEAKLLADDGAEGRRFGTSVSLSDGRALVGANDFDLEGGQAYVFARTASTWVQEAALVADDVSGGFGISVSLTEDRALVGAPFDPAGGFQSGAGYVFRRDGVLWTQELKLRTETEGSLRYLGWDVALDGDRALLGSPGDDPNGPVSGSAYVFRRGDGGWSQGERITPDDGASPDNFGWAVSLSGERALMGAPQDEDFGRWSGSAYVFSGIAPPASAPPPPRSVVVAQAQPNPAHRRATLALSTNMPERVRATLHDALGRELAVLHTGEAAGEVQLQIETARLAPGVYVVRVEGETFAETRRLTVIR